jgi:hypothetical protein
MRAVDPFAVIRKCPLLGRRTQLRPPFEMLVTIFDGFVGRRQPEPVIRLQIGDRKPSVGARQASRALSWSRLEPSGSLNTNVAHARQWRDG